MNASSREKARETAKAKREKDEASRWLHYATIPQRHWVKMSGRQARTINEQAKTHGIPFGGATVDLPAVVRGLHDFLAANKFKLTAAAGDPLMAGDAPSPALERYRAARAGLAELDLAERQGSHVKVANIETGLTQIFLMMRRAVEDLQRQFGNEASAIVHEAVDDAMVACTSLMGTPVGMAQVDKAPAEIGSQTEPISTGSKTEQVETHSPAE